MIDLLTSSLYLTNKEWISQLMKIQRAVSLESVCFITDNFVIYSYSCVSWSRILYIMMKLRPTLQLNEVILHGMVLSCFSLGKELISYQIHQIKQLSQELYNRL